MSSSESLTQKWLRQNVQPYAHKDRVYADISVALSRFPTLRPKSDVYTYDDGRTQLLLCLHGLLPISYRQASYNIPIAVWVTRDYPRQPPINYVVPTSDMLVKAGKFIDVSGRCNIEYSQHWERKSEGCSISALLEAMQDHFSREPPVYAKPKDSAIKSSSPVVSGSDDRDKPPPVPSATLQSSITHSDERPLLPPKPILQSTFPTLHSQPSSEHEPANSPSPSLANRPPPPLPPHPTTNIGPPQYQTYYRSSLEHPNFGSPQSRDTKNDVNVDLHDRFQIMPSQASTATDHQRNPPVPPLPSASPLANPVYPQPVSHPISLHLQSPLHINQPSNPLPATVLPPSIPPLNLLDEDSFESQNPPSGVSSSAPPPRPPNPELLHTHAQVHQKLKSELASLSQALSLDAERLRVQQKDLLAGEPAIRDEMARLEAVRDVCLNVAGRMRSTVEQAERNIAELRRKGDPEVDELVCSTTIVHNQLINLVAEDNAIEDTIYHLHRALNAGRVDLERFLRTTRVLAEEQFMKRALIEKIQNGILMGSGWYS